MYINKRLSLAIPLMKMFVTTVIVFMDIIHGPILYFKHKISQTAFCLHLQVKSCSVGANQQS